MGSEYAPDRLSIGATLAAMAASALGGGAATLLVWFILSGTNLPAFANSNLTTAVATAGTVVICVVVAVGCWLWLHGPKQLKPLVYLACYLAPAGIVCTTTAIPLSTTRLWLDGMTGDQEFRTQFLTRLTDSWHLSDMNYIDMPSFYPSGWFWLGGRMANLLGLPGWEAFQPWALVSIAAAVSLLTPVWQRIVGSVPVATGIALVTTCIVLVVSAAEPYAAIVAAGSSAAMVLAGRALRGAPWALAGVTIYLGISASMYTLYTSVLAGTLIVAAALVSALVTRSFSPLIRMIIIGVGSSLIALTVWFPYLKAVLTGQPRSGATSLHYLPYSGAQVPLPMFSFSLIGLLCMIGIVYMVLNVLDTDVMSLTITVIVTYCWIVASMVASLAGTTLLGFRLDAVIAICLSTAGVLGLAQLHLTYLPTRPRVTAAVAVVIALAGIYYAQGIPARNQTAIDRAHSDTDGYGERADRFAPGSATFYEALNDQLRTRIDSPADAVVLTDERSFLAVYPYRGFQAMTSHYANPLGQFDLRNTLIEHWADSSWNELSDPAAFKDTLAGSPWEPPQAFIFRGDADDMETGWKYDLAEDIYPNDPNVRFRGIFFNPAVFSAPYWDVAQVGPFVVVTLN
ncbi:hypothetical protein HMPREF1219_02472 [Corynebacterium pyruviciproducens ATCC BAA-1742]|uniref:Galactan 5-O-arabinofuranosyltransferase n=1 Tax=Corynebacterium pyruviciproducens ATCC BAA-1742 TaxID=1125779 RepID=S2YUJ0_9CORY|nr:galactan 5-O-arabinofuranosyltransferase [Corynebacterium pyruviciproducens]EPD68048.1 hypothetical protein HMPREF1219_02472 [Corynebacterium pyruviciproducens ATCC BAA-1742]